MASGLFRAVTLALGPIVQKLGERTQRALKPSPLSKSVLESSGRDSSRATMIMDERAAVGRRTATAVHDHDTAARRMVQQQQQARSRPHTILHGPSHRGFWWSDRLWRPAWC